MLQEAEKKTLRQGLLTNETRSDADQTVSGAGLVTPSLSLQWQHEFLDHELAIRSSFANGAGSPFTLHGPSIGRDSALVSAGINVAWYRYAIYLAYQAQLFCRNYESHSLLVGFRVSW